MKGVHRLSPPRPSLWTRLRTLCYGTPYRMTGGVQYLSPLPTFWQRLRRALHG